MKTRQKIILLVLFVTAVFLLGSGYHLLKKSQPERDDDLHEVTLRLKWVVQTQFAGYFVASEKGYYRDEGLLVRIEPGEYGKNPQMTVMNEVEEFGVQWASDLVAQGTECISLANVVKSNGFLLIAKKTSGISDISMMRGRKVATWFIGHEYLLYALLEHHGIPRSEVDIVSQRWDMSQFLEGEIDVASAMVYNELYAVGRQGYTSEKLFIYDTSSLGVRFPGQNIFTRRKYYLENPDICRGMVRASLRGWQYAIEHPEEATDIVMKFSQTGDLDREHQLYQMRQMIKLIMADNYKPGIHLEQDYRNIVKTFRTYGILDRDVDISEYFTNEYVMDDESAK